MNNADNMVPVALVRDGPYNAAQGRVGEEGGGWSDVPPCVRE